MSCSEATPLIGPYADSELDAAGILQLESHLRSCPACAAELRRTQALRKALKNEALQFSAPADLRRSLRAELRPATADRSPRFFFPWRSFSLFASGLAAASLALLLTLWTATPSAQQQLAREIVSNHIRSLMPGHELDVVSTDQHTVKPWFNGKLDFSPPVKDFASQGFPLVGGRLDYINGRSVAALIYQRRGHVLNVFVWPDPSSDTSPRTMNALHGYNLIHWNRSGMTFWLVSDLNPDELRQFANALTQ